MLSRLVTSAWPLSFPNSQIPSSEFSVPIIQFPRQYYQFLQLLGKNQCFSHQLQPYSLAAALNIKTAKFRNIIACAIQLSTNRYTVSCYSGTFISVSVVAKERLRPQIISSYLYLLTSLALHELGTGGRTQKAKACHR